MVMPNGEIFPEVHIFLIVAQGSRLHVLSYDQREVSIYFHSLDLNTEMCRFESYHKRGTSEP